MTDHQPMMEVLAPRASLPDPVICRRRLGVELRRLRLARSLRLEDVAAKLDVRSSTLSRIETGQARARTSYVVTMLDFYGFDDPVARRLLVDLAREGQRKGWWTAYDDVLPTGMGVYLGLESAASDVRCFAVQTIPSLLQTEDYAAAVWRAMKPDLDGNQVGRLVQVTMRRQKLFRDRGHQLIAILDESALFRRVGSANVMAGQLEYLTAMAASTLASVQLVELGSVWQVLSGSFTLLSFTDPADSDAASIEGIGGQAATVTNVTDVRGLANSFGALRQAAASTALTAERIGALGRKLRPS